MGNHRNLTQIALLAAFITVSGAIKLPSFIPGTEFQLSAPLAVSICYVFGAKIYLISGLISSAVGLMLGTQNILNVVIALVFRGAVLLCMALMGKNKLSLLLSGPVGSALARLVLAFWLDKAAYALLIAAAPGMVYTAICSAPLSVVLYKIKIAAWGAEKENAI